VYLGRKVPGRGHVPGAADRQAKLVWLKEVGMGRNRWKMMVDKYQGQVMVWLVGQKVNKH
jgi:hypothetical protein